MPDENEPNGPADPAGQSPEPQSPEFWIPTGTVVVGRGQMFEIDQIEPDQTSAPLGSTEVERETAKLIEAGAFRPDASEDLRKQVLRLGRRSLEQTLSESGLSEERRNAILAQATVQPVTKSRAQARLQSAASFIKQQLRD